MAEHKLDPNVRLLRDVALTTVLWATTFVVSRGEWFEGAHGWPVRALLVAIGIGGFLPIVFVYARSIRMQDEFSQRVHLIALAVAFAAVAAISYSADILKEAGFIAQVPGGGVWALMVAVWFIAMLVTQRFYR